MSEAQSIPPVEFRVAAILGGEAFDRKDEWERFRSLDEARRYMDLLAKLGLGCLLYSLSLQAGVQMMETLSESMRINL